MRLDTAMIYVKDMPRMVDFYGGTLGLRTITNTPQWAEFEAGVGKLGLHAIPPHIAETIEAGSAREETPIKLIFAVADVAAEAARLKASGATVIERPWGGCDVIDPEGNIFGLTAEARILEG